MKRTLFFIMAVTVLLSFGSWINSEEPYAEAFYPGGLDAVDNYMNDSAHYPEVEKSAAKEGFFIVDFEVSETGKAGKPVITALTDTSAGFTTEVRRLIAAMPLWDPARNKKGKTVTSSYRTYVKFELSDSLISVPDSSGSMAEEMPRFPGGEAGFQQYLHYMTRYPQREKREGKDGTVYIYFDITNKGKIENVSCKRGITGAPGLAEEAIRVVSCMPRWRPGRMNGKPVKVGMTVPVKFTLK